MCREIFIANKQEVEKLSRIASEQPYEVFVHSSDGRIMIDARSVLALFTMIGRPCMVVVEDDIKPKIFKKFLDRIGLAD